MKTCASCNRVYADTFEKCPHCRTREFRKAAIGFAFIMGFAIFIPFWLASGASNDSPPSKPPRPGETPVKQTDELSPLLLNCQPDSRVSCDDDLYKRVWLRLEADNGMMTKVDTNFRRSSVGTVEAIIYTYVPNGSTAFEPNRLRRLLFDCSGHYMDVTDQISPEMDAPPRSVAGRIAELACAK